MVRLTVLEGQPRFGPPNAHELALVLPVVVQRRTVAESNSLDTQA